MDTKNNIGTNREYKDRLLRLLFSDKARVLELYNGLNDSDYTNEDDLEVTTLEDVIYMKMKNDVSVLLDGRLQLYEHQSTYNPNMPIRGLLYFADLYRQLLHDKHIYSTKLIKIPTPRYIVLYNGDEDIDEEEWMQLSDAFDYGNEHSEMELKVQMININYGHNQSLMKKCRTLEGYAILVDKIKRYGSNMGFERAVDLAVTECIEEDVLREFLSKRRTEVMNALLTEYDEKRVLADIGQEYYEDGRLAGRAEGRTEGRAEGRTEGRAEGEAKLALLIEKLLKDSRMEDVIKVSADKEFREKLYEEYSIE